MTDYSSGCFDKKIYDIAIGFTGNLSEYRPFPGILDRAFWSDINSSVSKALVNEGNESLKSDYPVLWASHYLAFAKEGSRVAFETPYFKRRHMINDLVMAECIEDSGRFTDKIIDGVWAVCEESSWCLPAHNSYFRDTPQEMLPITDRPVIDLFACETAEMLATILYLIGDRLDAFSPIITARIRKELRARLIIPFINEHFWWMGNGDEKMCNWTPWCIQNVLFTTFLVPELTDNTEKKEILIKSAYALDCFLKDYGDDGCCDEGAHYYKHAGLCLYACLDVMNHVSGNTFESLYEDNKIKNIAAYISNVHVSGLYYFNFADCAAKVNPAGVREFLFGRDTKQKFLMDFAACDFINSVNDASFLTDESVKLNLFFKAQTAALAQTVLDYGKDNRSTPTLPPDIFYESVGIYITRNDSFTLAVKAGHNDDNHNHNDAGSFILYKEGRPVFVDIGVETYTRKTFSSERYDIWTMKSSYHNLPTIDGQDEMAGRKYQVTDVEHSESETSADISMNIATAYPCELPRYERYFSFDKKENVVTLSDKSKSRDIMLNFITYEKPVINETEDGFVLGNTVVSYQGGSLADIEELVITDERLKTSWDHNLYRVRIKSSGSFTMTVK